MQTIRAPSRSPSPSHTGGAPSRLSGRSSKGGRSTCWSSSHRGPLFPRIARISSTRWAAASALGYVTTIEAVTRRGRCLPLNAVRDVEHEGRPLALYDTRHELLKAFDKALVPFDRRHPVTAFSQRSHESTDRLQADSLSVGQTEQVNDVSALPVIDDRDVHAWTIQGSVQHTPGCCGRFPLGLH